MSPSLASECSWDVKEANAAQGWITIKTPFNKLNRDGGWEGHYSLLVPNSSSSEQSLSKLVNLLIMFSQLNVLQEISVNVRYSFPEPRLIFQNVLFNRSLRPQPNDFGCSRLSKCYWTESQCFTMLLQKKKLASRPGTLLGSFIKVELSPKSSRGFICDWIWVKPSCKCIHKQCP